MAAAATVQKHKNSIYKSKLKKTIKNVLCRPDPLFWPELSTEHEKELELMLGKYKVVIPDFKKLHWKELKSIPKEQRPKPPKLQKVIGLLFGLSECTAAVYNKETSAILIESTVNPQIIVQPLIEACIKFKVPFVCANGLKRKCAEYFGIPTTCLGVKRDYLQDISDKVADLVKNKHPPQKPVDEFEDEAVLVTKNVKTEKTIEDSTTLCPYLYRTNKKTRVFIPPIKQNDPISTNEFISLPNISKPQKDNVTLYTKMIVKRITNNPNRVKVKKVKNK